MLPSPALQAAIAALLANDANTLAGSDPPVAACTVALCIAEMPVVVSNLPADYTLASFTGSTPKSAAAGPQGVGTNPLTNRQVVTMTEPAGGWRYQYTAAPVLDPPQVVFGAILLDSAGTSVLGQMTLDAPVTIQNQYDEVNLGTVSLEVINPALT